MACCLTAPSNYLNYHHWCPVRSIRLRTIPLKMLKILVFDMGLKITNIRPQLHLWGANECSPSTKIMLNVNLCGVEPGIFWLHQLNVNNRPISLIPECTCSISHNAPFRTEMCPECTCSISHNAPFRTEMCTFLFWMEHCGIWNRCILGFVN